MDMENKIEQDGEGKAAESIIAKEVKYGFALVFVYLSVGILSFTLSFYASDLFGRISLIVIAFFMLALVFSLASATIIGIVEEIYQRVD